MAKALGWLALAAACTVVVGCAEPTAMSVALGALPAALGSLWLLWTGVHDAAQPVTERGGPYRHCRHPVAFGALLLGAGIVIAASSEGAWARWVPRTVAPLSLLVVFAWVLPAADRALRERAEAEGSADRQHYLQSVPALVPRARPWRGSGGSTRPGFLSPLSSASLSIALGAALLIFLALRLGRAALFALSA
ncbi:MAG: hypothetical protein JNJ88_02270 [Planctomycetes bacterium]|nr:hypothetical protein [Planctomycetota bacterium]